jgi:hypothetical protein
MADLTDFAAIAAQDSGLRVVSTLRADSTIQASIVNAGVCEHPVSGERGVAFVAMGGSRKLANLRARPRVTVVARAGWQWCIVENLRGGRSWTARAPRRRRLIQVKALVSRLGVAGTGVDPVTPRFSGVCSAD